MRAAPEHARAGINLAARVTDVISLGGVGEVLLETENGSRLSAHFNRRDSNRFAVGQKIIAFVRAEDLTCLDDA